MNRYATTYVAAAALVACVGVAARAHAATPAFDASNDTVTCNTFKGTFKLKPSYTFGGTSPVQAKVKGVLDGCIDSMNGVTILPSKVKGILALPLNDCNAVIGAAPISGTLTVKWKTSPSLVNNTSVITATTLTGGGFNAPWGGFYLQLDLGISGVSGSFTGVDGGASSTASIITSEDIYAFLFACNRPSGLKALTGGLGQVVLQ